TTTSDQLTPRGSASKPIRKRSRASKKTPTTLLNANTSNFRSLVQQFTGCPSTPLPLGSQRGPVNLNFGIETRQHLSNIATSIMAPVGSSNYYYQDANQVQHQQHQQVYQEQQCVFPFDSKGFSSSSISRSDMEIHEGFGLDDISLHELNNRDSFSNEIKNERYF
ncbi:VQ domain-containing protein, partial [Cephalotus follicularis]